MNEIDFTRVLPEGLEMAIGSGGALVLTVILVMAILFVKRWKGRIMPMFLGVAAYIMFAFLPTTVVLMLLSMVPSVSEGFTYNPQAYVIVNCGMLAITSLLARYVVGKMVTQRYERQGDIYMAGLGIGIGNALNYAMTTISMYIWCIAINSDGLISLLEDLSEEEAVATYESIEMLYTAPLTLWTLFAVNAVMDIVMQFILTNVTYGAMKAQIPTMWYSISAVITFVMLITFQMYDETSLTSIVIWFVVKAVLFAASAYYAHFVVSKEIKYVED